MSDYTKCDKRSDAYPYSGGPIVRAALAAICARLLTFPSELAEGAAAVTRIILHL